MAATAATLAALIIQLYRASWVEALFTNTFLLTRIQRKQGTSDGIRWRARYAGNASVGSYDETDTDYDAGNQSFKQAYLPWKQNKVNVAVSGLAQAISEHGGMDASAQRTEVDLALEDLRGYINDQLMSDGTGNSGKDITGLFSAISDAGTYAGLARDPYTWWGAYVNANGGDPRNLSEVLMRDVKSTVEGRGGRVSAIYAGSTQWYHYGDLLVSQRRQQNATSLTGGYQALDFEGIPLIKVPGYPATRMDFVDEALLEYVVLTDFTAEPMAKVVDAERILIKHYSQLACLNPYRMGSLQDLAE